MSILDILLGKKQEETPEKDEEPESSIFTSYQLKKYASSLPEVPDIIELSGAFLDEKYALKYISIYKELLRNTYYKINLCICRPIAIVCNDETFQTRDNERIKLGIQPANHLLEMCFDNGCYSIIGIDRNILLNTDDAVKLNHAIKHHPPTEQELKCIK
jgi:hypothetical protein